MAVFRYGLSGSNHPIGGESISVTMRVNILARMIQLKKEERGRPGRSSKRTKPCRLRLSPMIDVCDLVNGGIYHFCFRLQVAPGNATCQFGSGEGFRISASTGDSLDSTGSFFSKAGGVSATVPGQWKPRTMHTSSGVRKPIGLSAVTDSMKTRHRFIFQTLSVPFTVYILAQQWAFCNRH